MEHKKKETLNTNEVSGLPKGTIPNCPCCDADTLTVSMSNERPTKVWCSGGCGFVQYLEDDDKPEKKAEKKVK